MSDKCEQCGDKGYIYSHVSGPIRRTCPACAGEGVEKSDTPPTPPLATEAFYAMLGKVKPKIAEPLKDKIAGLEAAYSDIRKKLEAEREKARELEAFNTTLDAMVKSEFRQKDKWRDVAEEQYRTFRFVVEECDWETGDKRIAEVARKHLAAFEALKREEKK